jgi:ubiquinol-cytochrome c reductase iron-sulfur subunit
VSHDNLPAHGDDDTPPLPEHRPRRADTDPRAARRAEHQVVGLFLLSCIATIAFLVVYFAVPRDQSIHIPIFGDMLTANLALGLAMGIALFAIGAAAIHWAKKLMPDVEIVQERHHTGSEQEAKDIALTEYRRGVEESGFGRRPFIAGSMIAALGLAGLPALVLLRDLGPTPPPRQGETMWRAGMRILIAETQRPIRPEDLSVGTLVSGVPEGIDVVIEESGTLNELAKAPVLLVRMDPAEIVAQQGVDWDYEGILCFSKICTHVGCPLGLYETQTHHMLCPCHQSTFDLADAARVIFGPAARNLPQLAITVDDDGYLVARQGFAEPVGPSFWERG